MSRTLFEGNHAPFSPPSFQRCRAAAIPCRDLPQQQWLHAGRVDVGLRLLEHGGGTIQAGDLIATIPQPACEVSGPTPDFQDRLRTLNAP